MPRITAVIVTYNADAGFRERLKAIARESTRVMVVDNGSRDQASLKKATRLAKVELISLGKNTGIAHAQNVGLSLAFAKKADAAILYDHDSSPRPGFAAALWQATDGGRAEVIAGGRVFDVHMQRFARHPCYARVFFARRVCGENAVLADAIMVIASGTLVTRAVYEKTGGMREELFIDYVDWEFCLRARHVYGVNTVVVGSAVLDHARGVRTGRRLFGLKVYPPGYSAFRYEHMFRNRARLLRAYFWRDRAFVAFELVATLRDVLLLIAEPKPLRLMWLAIRSWFSGLFRRSVR